MKTLYLNILLSITSVVLFSCANQELRIQTTPPEARVLISNSSGDTQDLGKSPVTLSISDLNVKAPFFIELSKEGHLPKSIFIPTLNANTLLKAQVTLNPKSEMGSLGSSNSVDGNTLVKEISLVHNHITKKEYFEAQNRLLVLTGKHSSYPSLWSLLGNVYFLQRKWDSALEAYSKAFDLDPSAVEVKSMMDRVRSLKGGS